MELDDPVAFVTGVMVLVGFATWVWRVPWRFLRRLLGFLRGFMDDWAGVPAEVARPGHPAREAVPGVMERLQRIDGQMGRNGGSTLADVVHATSQSVDELHHRLPCLAHEPCTELDPQSPDDHEGGQPCSSLPQS